MKIVKDSKLLLYLTHDFTESYLKKCKKSIINSRDKRFDTTDGIFVSWTNIIKICTINDNEMSYFSTPYYCIKLHFHYMFAYPNERNFYLTVNFIQDYFTEFIRVLTRFNNLNIQIPNFETEYKRIESYNGNKAFLDNVSTFEIYVYNSLKEIFKKISIKN